MNKSANPGFSIPQVQHMMHQASNIFNGNPEFISLIFDMLRHRTSTGVAATIRNDPHAIEQHRYLYVPHVTPKVTQSYPQK